MQSNSTTDLCPVSIPHFLTSSTVRHTGIIFFTLRQTFFLPYNLWLLFLLKDIWTAALSSAQTAKVYQGKQHIRLIFLKFSLLLCCLPTLCIFIKCSCHEPDLFSAVMIKYETFKITCSAWLKYMSRNKTELKPKIIFDSSKLNRLRLTLKHFKTRFLT